MSKKKVRNKMKNNIKIKGILIFSLIFLFFSFQVYAKSIFVNTSTGRITVRAKFVIIRANVVSSTFK